MTAPPAPAPATLRGGRLGFAAVEGYAIGVGWSLALACDLLVASRTAFFAAPAGADFFEHEGLAVAYNRQQPERAPGVRAVRRW